GGAQYDKGTGATPSVASSTPTHRVTGSHVAVGGHVGPRPGARTWAIGDVPSERGGGVRSAPLAESSAAYLPWPCWPAAAGPGPLIVRSPPRSSASTRTRLPPPPARRRARPTKISTARIRTS